MIHDISKLPKWAREHISHLERRIATLSRTNEDLRNKGELEFAQPGDALACDYNPDRTHLFDGRDGVAFKLPDGGKIRVRYEGPGLQISEQGRAGGGLIIRPQGANAIKVLSASVWED
jgi:hypothetical protein